MDPPVRKLKGQKKRRRVAVKAAAWGLLGSLGLVVFYFATLLLVNRDIRHPWRQFLLFQPWMGLLILGFGVQVGLFSLLRVNKEARVLTGAGAGVSGVSMAACCAHHLVDVMPILGVSGLAIFLGEYQKQLLILGVVMNFIGVGIMIRMVNKIKQI